MLTAGNMKDFFKLIRWPNLLIVALTMLAMRYAIIGPLLARTEVVLRESHGYPMSMMLQLPWQDFLVLVLATVSITAAGYVINDYFDIKTDLVNKGRVIVGTAVPRRRALMFHNILNILGVASGFYVSWRIGYPLAGVMFLLVTGLFYFYSASYKRQFLLGNILVAFLTATLPLLVLFYEWAALYNFYSVHAADIPSLRVILWWICGFSLFAFLTTLTREIIKDIEDFKGDSVFGRNTLPVVLGVKTSVNISVSLTALILIMLWLVWYFFVRDVVTLVYISVFLALPLGGIMFLLKRGRDTGDYHKASTMMKLVMLGGLLYSVVARVIMTYNLY